MRDTNWGKVYKQMVADEATKEADKELCAVCDFDRKECESVVSCSTQGGTR